MKTKLFILLSSAMIFVVLICNVVLGTDNLNIKQAHAFKVEPCGEIVGWVGGNEPWDFYSPEFGDRCYEGSEECGREQVCVSGTNHDCYTIECEDF